MRLISKIIPNVPYKLVNNKLFEINELCEGVIQNNIKIKQVRPHTINSNEISLNPEICKKIPILMSNKPNLEYFNCKLISNMNLFVFDNNNDNINLSLCEKNFYPKNNYKLKTNNYPNFIFPSNIYSNGFVILGKDKNSHFELTGFKIPLHCGLYIPYFMYYNTNYLNGNWNFIKEI